MKFEKNDFFTGLFVLVGSILGMTAVLVLVAFNVLSDRTEYVLRMDKIAGVKKGTPIRIKNFTVGEVDEVFPIYGSDLYFKARIYIDRSLVLYRGTKANITNQNVIGDPVIDLLPAFSGKYPLKEGDTLFASNIVNLDEMVSQISAMIQNIGSMIESLSGIAGDSKGDIRMLLSNLNRSIIKVNSVLDASQGELIAIMQNVRSTSATLDKFTKELAADPWKVLEKKNSRSSSSGSRPALP